MPLHRDIHWIGRQWAVTGHGMQLIDQKLQGFFDIAADRLWDDALIENLHAKEWLNRADFDKGLALARARYPQAPRAVAPPRRIPPAPAIEPAAPLPPVVKPIEPKPDPVRFETPRPAAPPLAKPALVEPPTAVAAARPVAPAAAIAPAPPLAAVAKAVAPEVKTPRLAAPEPVTVTLRKHCSAEPSATAIALQAPAAEAPKPPPSLFQMRYECRAKFVRPWRVVTKRPT